MSLSLGECSSESRAGFIHGSVSVLQITEMESSVFLPCLAPCGVRLAGCGCWICGFVCTFVSSRQLCTHASLLPPDWVAVHCYSGQTHSLSSPANNWSPICLLSLKSRHIAVVQWTMCGLFQTSLLAESVLCCFIQTEACVLLHFRQGNESPRSHRRTHVDARISRAVHLWKMVWATFLDWGPTWLMLRGYYCLV